MKKTMNKGVKRNNGKTYESPYSTRVLNVKSK